MELGFVGLGRMGRNMVVRLARGKHRVVAWAPSPESVQDVAREGAIGASNLPDLISKLKDRPRAVWTMV
ncbi:MAG TPA: NAD(P)-binding domain-containing protein, partial [Candidatus Eisenbacteria bacterium]|nr:NAD(P)-binding domain-containing protein [Candidatus Eisenbacteria bacterium]